MNNECKQKNASSKSKETVNAVPFFKLFFFADSTDKILMIIGTIGAIGNGLSQPLLSVLLGDVTDSFGRNISPDDVVPVISKVCLKFVYLALGTGVAAFLQVACWMTTGERQATRIRCKYLKTILRQDISFFDTETKTGEIVSSMSGDIVLLQDAIGEKVGKCIQLYVTFIGGFAIAFGKGWLLTLVMLASIVPMVVSGGIFAILISRMSSRVHKAYSKAAVVVDQTIGSIRTVASFTGEKRAITEYNNALDAAYKSSVSQGLATGMGLGSLLSIVFCAFSLATFYGGKLVAEKKITAAEFLTVIIAVLIGSSALGQASPCVTAFTRGRSAAFRIIQTTKRKPKIDARNTSGKSPDTIHGVVELKDVYFSYPSRPEEPIIKGFSLFIPKGKSTALVGHSGSGKSTVINLIERFYDPQEGEVLIDGINIKEFQLIKIREKIALVSQEPVLFMASIKDNIAYGKPSATVDEIMMAADTANATNFINQLPEGIETMVGEHGAQLSGGQKQRIAIARAILKDPRILLLDEATSALDVESERTVQKALDGIMVSRTTVIVAHRLRTTRNSNMIVVVDQGKIVEKGSHSELIKDEEGVYSQLIRLQEVNHENEQRFEEDEKKTNNSQEFSSETLTMSSGDGSNIKLEAYLHMSDTNDLITLQKILKLEHSVPVPGKEKGPPLENPIRRLAYLNKPELPVLVGGTIASIINGAVLPILGMLIAEALKTFYEPKHELEKNSRHLALKFLFTGFVTLLAYPTSGYLFGVAGSKLIKRIRSMCFEKIVYMEAGWFDQPENSSGVIGAKLSTDVANLNALIGDALAQTVQVTSSIVTGLIVAFDASWQLTLIILAMIPMLGLNGYVLLKFSKGFSEDSKGMYEEASQIANDAVGSIRTVASFCAEEKVVDLYQRKCEVPMKKGIRQGLLSGIFFGSSSAMLFLVYSTGFYAGARFIKDGKISFSDVFQVLFAVIMSFTAISATTSMAPDSNKAKSAALSIFSILDLKQKIDSKKELGITLESLKGEIVFQHVSFRYPTRPDIYVLRDLSLTIHSGKTVALVGESGSGKSTVISLLQRFYDPELGHITLDGIQLQKFQLKWLRQQMGLVSQEPVLFNDTIRTNIAYGKDEGSATATDILTAAEVANAHNFISGLQMGYETMVGERGIQLSGGQKQRVAIARAFIKSPKILLLDEATSALDTESERIVQDALRKVVVNRTTVIVAHRLSTIKNADVIVVVKNGSIVEKGTHETLANIEGGLYASLVALHMNNASFL